MTTARAVFLPWVRQGAAASIGTVDTLQANLPAAVELSAALVVNERPPVTLPVRLRGPADVVGIDPLEIVRMDPRPGTADFEPNYFAAVEFDRPDFPWLYTPARADAQGRLRPWLVLVVVRKGDGVLLRAALDGPLPVLDIGPPARPAEELPDLDESWAWAHAQVAATAQGATEVGQALGGASELSLSRLLCPRKLEPNTDYLACVVPAFDLGRRACLGEPITDEQLTGPNGLQPAWAMRPAPPARVSLPVYHQWAFRTGEGGDFESLVRLLSPQPAPAGLGTRPVGIGRPGFPLPAGFPAGATLPLEGALLPVRADGTTAPPTWPPGTEAPLQAELAKIVNAPGLAGVADPDADPLLAPPLYGRWHAARATVTRGGTTWLDTLNLDPRWRAAAAFGTRVVQEHQEALMAAAWEQAAELKAANQRLRQLQLSLVVGASLHARHFGRLPDDVMVQVGEPAFARLRVPTPDATRAPTMVTRLVGSAVPVKAASAPMRRLGRARGPITRRIAAQGFVRGQQTWIARLNVVGNAFIPSTWLDTVTVNAVRLHLTQPERIRIFSAVTDQTMATTNGRPTFRVVAELQPVPVPTVFKLPPSADNATARAFRAAAVEHLARIRPGRLGIIFGPPPQAALRQIRDELFDQIEPQRALVALARAVVATGTGTSPPTRDVAPTGPAPIDTVLFAPTFRQPMVEPLRDLSPSLLLPGLESVLPNSVIGLATNRRFVESYLVGLNVEMAHEMLWRGFPTDQRGTCFAHFWNTAGAAQPRPDIAPLHEWATRRLGDAAGAPVREQFVMLLRSSLLRRYPGAVIYAAKAVLRNGQRVPSLLPGEESYPAFRGSMEPDVSFFGFDLAVADVMGSAAGGTGLGWYIVIQEQPGEPRFGLDVDTPSGSGSHLRVADGAPPGLPTGGAMAWGRNGAHVAGLLRQAPVRIAIHASRFLPRG